MTDDRRAIKEMAAELVRREVVPHLDDWERDGEVPPKPKGRKRKGVGRSTA